MTETAKGLIKPLVWNYFEVAGRFGLMGVWDANSVAGTFTIDRTGDMFCFSLRGAIPALPVATLDEAKKAAADHLESKILPWLDIDAYRAQIRAETLEDTSARRFVKAPEPVANPDADWCRRYAEWHQDRYGKATTRKATS